MKDGKDKYGDFLRSNPAAYFTVIMFPLLLFFIFLISIVAVLSSGDTPISFGLIIEILITILCGFLGIRGLVKFIRYFLDPEEREKRKSEMRRRIDCPDTGQLQSVRILCACAAFPARRRVESAEYPRTIPRGTHLPRHLRAV